jgi:hypothetical protein
MSQPLYPLGKLELNKFAHILGGFLGYCNVVVGYHCLESRAASIFRVEVHGERKVDIDTDRV